MEISRIFLKISARQMFGHLGLDVGYNISRFHGDTAIPIDENPQDLFDACLRHFKSDDKTSFQFHNLFHYGGP